MSDDVRDVPERAARRVTVTNVTDPPEEFPYALSIEVDDPSVTRDSTATLTFSITNTGDDPGTFMQTLRKERSGAHGREGILLFDTDAPDAPPADYAPPCLRGTSPTEYERGIVSPHGFVGFTMEGPPTFELQPGETWTGTLLVVDDPTVNDCVPVGEYEFEKSYPLTPPSGRARKSQTEPRDSESFDWSFTLVVEDVEG